MSDDNKITQKQMDNDVKRWLKPIAIGAFSIAGIFSALGLIKTAHEQRENDPFKVDHNAQVEEIQVSKTELNLDHLDASR